MLHQWLSPPGGRMRNIWRQSSPEIPLEYCTYYVFVAILFGCRVTSNRFNFRATKCTTPQIHIWPCLAGSLSSSTIISSPLFPISPHIPSTPSGWRRTRLLAQARPLPRFRYVFEEKKLQCLSNNMTMLGIGKSVI